MPKRKRGGQPGNQNALKHGRHSAPVRDARRAAVLALYEESKRKSDKWIRSRPPTDYRAIVDHLRVIEATESCRAVSSGETNSSPTYRRAELWGVHQGGSELRTAVQGIVSLPELQPLTDL